MCFIVCAFVLSQFRVIAVVANRREIIIGKWYEGDAARAKDDNRSDTEVDVNQWYTGGNTCILDIR